MSDNSRVFFYFVSKRTFSNIKNTTIHTKNTPFTYHSQTLGQYQNSTETPHIHLKSVKNLGVLYARPTKKACFQCIFTQFLMIRAINRVGTDDILYFVATGTTNLILYFVKKSVFVFKSWTIMWKYVIKCQKSRGLYIESIYKENKKCSKFMNKIIDIYLNHMISWERKERRLTDGKGSNKSNQQIYS